MRFQVFKPLTGNIQRKFTCHQYANLSDNKGLKTITKCFLSLGGLDMPLWPKFQRFQPMIKKRFSWQQFKVIFFPFHSQVPTQSRINSNNIIYQQIQHFNVILSSAICRDRKEKKPTQEFPISPLVSALGHYGSEYLT